MPSSTGPIFTITPLSGTSFWNTVVQFGREKMARCTSVPTLRASAANPPPHLDTARPIAADLGMHQAGDAAGATLGRVIVDALDQRAGAVADTGNRDTNFALSHLYNSVRVEFVSHARMVLARASSHRCDRSC